MDIGKPCDRAARAANLFSIEAWLIRDCLDLFSNRAEIEIEF